MARKKKGESNGSGANLGFEATLWAAADKLRGNIDASDYKHVVLGLIFLKYISDAFTERRQALLEEIKKEQPALFTAEARKPFGDTAPESTLPDWVRETLDDRDEYVAEHVFFVPDAARWDYVQAQAKLPTIGKTVDEAMLAIEKENPRLRGVLPKDFGREQLDKRRLGELVDLIGSIQLGDKENRSKDVLGRVYEYFLGQFASSEGKKGGEYFTPQSVVRVLVEMLEPHEGSRIYDPCCGSGGMFVQSEKFIEQHGGRKGRIAVYGQELNHTTWRLAQMNLAIRGIEATIEEGDTFHADKHPDLKADFVIANPPFNISDWGGDRLRQDVRWKYGTPPAGNANFAWVQHFIHHLAPNGTAGFVLANGSLSSSQSGEGDIRKAIVEADLVDCIVALPDRLFYTTPIPVCLWFLSRTKSNRSRRILLLDASGIGQLASRNHRVISNEEISALGNLYSLFRTGKDVPTMILDGAIHAKVVVESDLTQNDYDLNPPRYTGSSVATSRSSYQSLTESSVQRIVGESGASPFFSDCYKDYLTDLFKLHPELIRQLLHDSEEGKVGDLAELHKKIIDPAAFPQEEFDSYSIPAYDAGKLPEVVAGKSVLSGKILLTKSCLLVSKLNPRTPRLWSVDLADGRRSFCSTEFAVLLPISGIQPYLAFILRSEAFWAHLRDRAKGSTGSRQRVNSRDVLAAPIPIPSPRTLEVFNVHLAPLVQHEQFLRLHLKGLQDAIDATAHELDAIRGSKQWQ